MEMPLFSLYFLQQDHGNQCSAGLRSIDKKPLSANVRSSFVLPPDCVAATHSTSAAASCRGSTGGNAGAAQHCWCRLPGGSTLPAQARATLGFKHLYSRKTVLCFHHLSLNTILKWKVNSTSSNHSRNLGCLIFFYFEGQAAKKPSCKLWELWHSKEGRISNDLHKEYICIFLTEKCIVLLNEQMQMLCKHPLTGILV